MTRRGALFCVIAAASFLLSAACLAIADDRGSADFESVQSSTVPDTDIVEPDELVTENVSPGKASVLSEAFAGYRIFSIDSYGGRAAEYEYLHSSPVFGALYNSLSRDFKYSLDGNYLNDKDYHGDFKFDYLGDYRVHFRTESLFHNLDHEQLGPSFTLGTSPSAQYNLIDLDPSGTYGMKVEQDQATFRYKVHDWPIHINLGYWRIIKEGEKQQIFADQAFEGATNTIYSRARTVDRQTHEGTAGFDAHLGPVDLIYTFRIRQFEDNAGIPADPFVARPDLFRSAGILQHNEDPDSRFVSHTVKMHTSLAGGIVGAASYTYGKRDNLSRLTDISGAGRTSTIIQNAAGDFMYMPCKEFLLAVKYRLQQIDRDNPSTITSLFSVPQVVDVRPSPDTRTDVLTATFSVKPAKFVTFNGEYKGSFVHRDNLNNGSTLLNWRDLPGNSDTHQGTFTILSRPMKGLRLKALYRYSATDHPSYGNSFSQRHEGRFLAIYNSINSWGVTANYTARRESNDDYSRSVIATLTPDVTFTQFASPLPRSAATDTVTASAWFTPFDRLTVTASYAILRTKTDETVLFTGFTNAVPDASDYTAQSQIYSLNALYHMNEMIDLSLMLQQVRSYAEFDPTFLLLSSSPPSDTGGIEEISSTKTIESSLSARSDFRFNKYVSCAVDYTFRDYDEKSSSSFDGTVHTVMFYLNAKW